MLDRLVELLYRAHHNASCVLNEGCSEDDAIEEEARYLLANGVFAPPCKAGDTIYNIDVYPWNSECGDCEYFDCGGFGDSPSCMKTDDGRKHRECRKISEKIVTKDDIPSLMYFNQFGKTVFLTREEAERALKGGAEE